MRTSWNYRVIEFVDPSGTPWRAIHEVYYENGHPTVYSEDPAPVTATEDDGDMKESIKTTLRMMADALEKSVLVERDFAMRSSETGAPAWKVRRLQGGTRGWYSWSLRLLSAVLSAAYN